MTRVQRRQRLAGAVVVGAAAAFIWSGAPEAIAAARAHLSLADVLVLLLVAAVGFAALVAVLTLLLSDALRAHARGLARLDALADRETRGTRRATHSPARLALTIDRRAS